MKLYILLGQIVLLALLVQAFAYKVESDKENEIENGPIPKAEPEELKRVKRSPILQFLDQLVHGHPHHFPPTYNQGRYYNQNRRYNNNYNNYNNNYNDWYHHHHDYHHDYHH